MVQFCAKLTVIVAIFAAALSPIYAVTVTVSPSHMGDWSTNYNPGRNGGFIRFTAGGPAPAEGNPFPTGNGAFLASLTGAGDTAGETPDSAWLGTDKQYKDANTQLSLVGVKLSQITKMDYVAYNGGMYNAYFDTSGNPRRHPKQPFMLTLTIQDLQGNRRQLWFRPWTLSGFPHWNNRREWLTLDAMNMTSTPNPGALTPVWYEFTSGVTFNSWLEVLQSYADWTLVPTSTGFDPTLVDPLGWQSPGFDSSTKPVGEPRTTGTGKCLNFWIGARKASQTPFGAWWQESTLAYAYVDSFILGVDFGTEQTPDVVETTYDFASDTPAPTVVAMSNMGSGRWTAPAPYAYPYAKVNPTTTNINSQLNFTYRFFGKVVDLTNYLTFPAQLGPGVDPDTSEFYFTIWDGSYAAVSDAVGEPWCKWGSVTVRLPWQDCAAITSDPATWPVQIGDYVEVQGFIFNRCRYQRRPPAEITAKSIVKYAP